MRLAFLVLTAWGRHARAVAIMRALTEHAESERLRASAWGTR